MSQCSRVTQLLDCYKCRFIFNIYKENYISKYGSLIWLYKDRCVFHLLKREYGSKILNLIEIAFLSRVSSIELGHSDLHFHLKSRLLVLKNGNQRFFK